MGKFVNYKKGCTRLAAASDKVYQLLAHGRWFSPASSTTKTGCHDIAEILLKVALNTINQIKSNLLAIALFVLLQFIASDDLFDIFKPYLYQLRIIAQFCLHLDIYWTESHNRCL